MRPTPVVVPDLSVPEGHVTIPQAEGSEPCEHWFVLEHSVLDRPVRQKKCVFCKATIPTIPRTGPRHAEVLCARTGY